MLTIGPVTVWTGAEDEASPADADVAPAGGWSSLAAGLIGEAADVKVDLMRVAWKPAGARMPTQVYSKGQRISVGLGLAGITSAWLARSLGVGVTSVDGAASGDSDTAKIDLPVSPVVVSTAGRFALLLRGPSPEFGGKNLQVYLPGAECLSALEFKAGTEDPAMVKFMIEGMGVKLDGTAFAASPHVWLTTGVRP